MEFKHKAGLKTVYYLLAGLGFALQAWLEFLTQHPLSMTLVSGMGLLLLGYGLYLLISRSEQEAALLPVLTLLLLGGFTLLESHADNHHGHWIYLFPLYLFSLLRFRLALPCAGLYALLISLLLVQREQGIALYQTLFLFWTTTAVAATFTFINLSKKQQLRKLQITDPDTCALNFSQLRADLKREISRARREHSGLALLLLTPSHPLSTEDLYTLTQQLQSWLRPFDRLYRYNAHQLAVLLPDKTNRQAQALASRLRQSSPLLKGATSGWVSDCLLLGEEESADQMLIRSAQVLSAPGQLYPLPASVIDKTVPHV